MSHPELKNLGQATVDQLARWSFMRNEKAVINGQMVNGILFINYRTKTGYYVQAVFNQYGQETKRLYFYDWDPNNQEPTKPVFPEHEDTLKA